MLRNFICFNPWFDGLLYKDMSNYLAKARNYKVSTLDLMDCYIKTIVVSLNSLLVCLVSTLDLMDCYIKTLFNLLY